MHLHMLMLMHMHMHMHTYMLHRIRPSAAERHDACTHAHAHPLANAHAD